MTTPTIPDLPVATLVNDSDQLLVRQPAGGLGTDKSCTAQQIRNLNLSGLAGLPTGTPNANDLMLIARSGTNYQITFQNVGFIQGTKMWFYHNAAGSSSELPGWSIFANGDTLLAVKGGSTYTVGGSQQGTWQQVGVSLSISQIPAHTHRVPAGKESAGSAVNPGYARRSRDIDVNTTITTGTAGSGQPHNHGDTWRPRASVGIICQKN